jgi:geranylgeranyl pyrophosphate synthase
MTRTELLASFLGTTRARVDAALDAFLPRPPACPAIVADAMRYSVFAGGKRLRPILTLAAADAVARGQGVDGEHGIALALPAACAIEMIHTYSLIHDDLPAMDDDMLRRGRPTLHVVYGEGIAILAGDGLHAEAFTLLAKAPDTDAPDILARKLRVLRVIGQAAGPAGMVGGQTIDLQAAGRAVGPRLTLDAGALREMHARKTGALIRASATAGAVMAGGDEALIETIDRFARDLGLAFQIVDDILDVEGEAHELGKTVGKDAAEAKPTYPAIFGLERSRAMAAELAAGAHAALDATGLTAELLHAIADWAVTRKN